MTANSTPPALQHNYDMDDQPADAAAHAELSAALQACQTYLLPSYRQADAGALRNQLSCYHKSNLHNPVWTSGKDKRYGLGPYMVVNDRMFLVNDDAELSMFRFNMNSVDSLDSFSPFEDGVDAWGPLAFADGFLIMRDSHRMLCLDLR